jgi:hypothetical protein
VRVIRGVRAAQAGTRRRGEAGKLQSIYLHVLRGKRVLLILDNVRDGG